MDFTINTTGVLISALTFTAVFCIGGAFIAAGASQRQRIQSRLRMRNEFAAEPPPLPRRAATSFFTRVGQRVSPKGQSDGLQKQMSKAGYYSQAAGAVFIGVKAIMFMAGFVLALAAFAVVPGPLVLKLMGVISFAGVMFFVPNVLLSLRISQRQQEIKRHLPDAVDLLEICVSGGMGLDQAWVAVEDQVRPVSQELANEVALSNLEIHLGADRGTAMRHMAERTGADELNSLVAVLVQSERFGTSLTEALRVFTTNMREMRSQRAEENAEKMAVKMIFPMVALIFPVILIIAVGPAGITLAEILGGK